MSKLKSKTSFSKKLACVLLSILTIISFTPFHVFAGTVTSDDSGNAETYGTEAYWKAYYGVSSIGYYDNDIEKTPTLSGSYTGGCGKAGVYFIKENHKIEGAATKSGLTISGNVTLIFVTSKEYENGPSLTATGGKASGQTGAGAGILLSQNNSLLVKGIGTLEGYGGQGAAGATGGTGANGKNDEGKTPDDMTPGKGGTGGAGGGGAGAGIGTAGASGADQVVANSNSTQGATLPYDKNGATSKNGNSNPNSSSIAGALKVAGNVKINVVAGGTSSNSNRSGAGVKAKTSHQTVSPTYYDAGGGAGGGNGGNGLAGAKIGSGGVGGASGGTGGSGSWAYAEDWLGESHYHAHGGGGGGGAGSGTSLGGGAETSEKGKFDYAASSGSNGGSSSAGAGGLGAHKSDASATPHGMQGGNGGTLTNQSGTAEPCYSSTQKQSAGTNTDFVGKEAQIYEAFPADECEIQFQNPTGLGNDVYKYTGSQIKPVIKVVHIPTGTVLNTSAYTISYGSNKDVGDIANNYVQVTGNSIGDHQLLMNDAMTQAGGTITTNFKIKWGVEIKYEEMPVAPGYNGEPVDFGEPTVTKEYDGSEVTDYDDLDETILNSSGKKVEKAIDAGDYTLNATTDPSDPYYTSNATGFSQKFTVKPATITVTAGSAQVEKEYDGTTDIVGYTGKFRIDGTIYDRDKVEVGVDTEKTQGYDTPDVSKKKGTAVAKLQPIKGESNAGTSNYTLKDDGIVTDIPFIINPCHIEVSGGTAVDKKYDGNNFVEMKDATFKNVPAGQTLKPGVDYSIPKKGVADGSEPGTHVVKFEVENKNGNYIFTNEKMTQVGETTVKITSDNKVDPPTPSTTEYIYNGTEQTYDVPGTDDYSVSNNKATDAGVYHPTYELKVEDSEWNTSEGGRAPITFDWTIAKAEGQNLGYSDIYFKPGTQERTYTIPKVAFHEHEDMLKGLEFKGVEKTSANVGTAEVDKKGNLVFALTADAKDKDEANIVVNFECQNYEPSTLELTINVVDKLTEAVIVGDITVPETKVYDGKAVEPKFGSNLALQTKDGKKICDLTKDDLKVTYYDKGTEKEVDKIVDAGNYKISIELKEGTQYEATIAKDTTITPLPVQLKSTLQAEKDYDGTIDPVDYTGSLNIMNIVGKDDVTATAKKESYTTGNVHDTYKDIGVTLSGADAANYTAEGVTCQVHFVINAVVLTLDDQTVISAERPYKYGDGSITFDLNSVPITGFIPSETIDDAKATVQPTPLVSQGTASVGEYNNVPYIVQLARESNYVFADKQYSAKGYGNATITQAPGQDLGEVGLTYSINDPGEKEYKIDFSKLPGGMEEGISLEAASKIDENDIISSWDVDNNGVVSFTIAEGKSEGDEATLNVGIESKNYGPSAFRLNINLVDKVIVDVAGITIEDKTYDGEPIEPTGDLKITDQFGNDITDQFNEDEITYSYQKLNTAFNFTDEETAPKNAAKYKLVIDATNDIYTGTSEIEFTIAPKDLQIEGKTLKAVAGEKAPNLATIDRDKVYEVIGLVDGETLVKEPTMTYEKTPDMSKSGEYVIKLGPAEATDNYFIDHASDAKLVVTGSIDPNPHPVPPINDDDNGNGHTKGHGVGTGDDSLAFLFAGLGIATVTTMIFLGMRRREKNR